ncbi:MAG: hypothetical protein ACFE9L_10565 [Candidatus Hodarchaeota archaeon]
MVENTIKIYLSLLKNIATDPDKIETYFGDKNLKAKKSKVAAYRSYLNFLDVKNKITLKEYSEAFKTIKPPKKRDNHVNEKKWSEPKEK